MCLIPGEACTYTLKLEGDVAEQYEVHLLFEEMQSGTLKNYAYIRIEANGQVLCDQLMATVLAGEGIDLFVDLHQVEQQEVIITYYLPIEVGNEAKNAEAVFDLLITASNEWGWPMKGIKKITAVGMNVLLYKFYDGLLKTQLPLLSLDNIGAK